MKLPKVLAVALVFLLYSHTSWAMDVWYDEGKSVHVWFQGNDLLTGFPLYSEQPEHNARKMMLTGRIIIQFKNPQSQLKIKSFEDKYSLILIEKLRVGLSMYVFKSSDVRETLNLANRIYSDGMVQTSYPDWEYVIGNER